RGCAGDPDGLAGDPIGFGGAEVARAREAPRPIDEDPDPEPLALAGCDALDAAGLDGDRFVESANDADVGVARTELDGRIEGAVAQVTHRDAEGSSAARGLRSGVLPITAPGGRRRPATSGRGPASGRPRMRRAARTQPGGRAPSAGA